jgi:phosphopentomutase
MKLARQTWPNCKLAAFSCWAPINTGIIERSSACHSISLPDPELAEAAAVYIQANSDLRIMFIQFDKIDTSGHEFGYGSQPFLNKITETDGYVGIILDAIHHAGLWDDSLIILTADHGGGGDNAYSHGSDHPLDMTIFWSCYGPGIIQGEMSSEVNIKDTSAVVATALGLPIPEKWEAITPKGLFKNG